MIYGVGTDIIEVARIEKQLRDDSGFKERIFSAGEIEYCEGRSNRAQNYAARFAAKEAFFKALGSGWRGGLKHRDVEVANDDLGKPRLVLHGKARELTDEVGAVSVHVSLSHLADLATAVVVIEK